MSGGDFFLLKNSPQMLLPHQPCLFYSELPFDLKRSTVILRLPSERWRVKSVSVVLAVCLHTTLSEQTCYLWFFITVWALSVFENQLTIFKILQSQPGKRDEEHSTDNNCLETEGGLPKYGPVLTGYESSCIMVILCERALPEQSE